MTKRERWMEIKYKGKDIKAFVFDLDGTLYKIGFFTKISYVMNNIKHLSFFVAHRKAMKDLRKEDHGSKQVYFEKLFGKMAELTGSGKETIEQWYLNDFRKDFINTLANNFRKNKALESVVGILKGMGFKTAVLSDFGFIEERLEALNIDKHLFNVLVSGEEEGALKPQIRPLMKIADEFGVQPENTVLIGDREDTDGAVAEKAGMEFINVKNIIDLENILKHMPGVV